MKLLSSEAFFSPKCSKYRSLSWGSLQRSPDPLAKLRGHTSKWKGVEEGEGRGKFASS